MEEFSYRKEEHTEGKRYIIVGDTRKVVRKGMMSNAMKMKFDWDKKYWWTSTEQKIKRIIVVLNQEVQKQELFRRTKALQKNVG